MLLPAPLRDPPTRNRQRNLQGTWWPAWLQFFVIFPLLICAVRGTVARGTAIGFLAFLAIVTTLMTNAVPDLLMDGEYDFQPAATQPAALPRVLFSCT